MLTGGTLKAHCLKIQEQAQERMDRLTAQMAKAEGVNEALKVADQIKWMAAMNSIQSRAEELVLQELVYG